MTNRIEFGLQDGANAGVDGEGNGWFECPRCSTAIPLTDVLPSNAGDTTRCRECGLTFGGVAVRISDPTYSRDQLIRDTKGRPIE